MTRQTEASTRAASTDTRIISKLATSALGTSTHTHAQTLRDTHESLGTLRVSSVDRMQRKERVFRVARSERKLRLGSRIMVRGRVRSVGLVLVVVRVGLAAVGVAREGEDVMARL